MATVKFGEKLNKSILQNAAKKMQFAVDRAVETKPDNSWGQRIYDTIFAGVKPIIAQLPAGWLKTVDRMDIEQVGDTICNMRFNFSPAVPWPNVFVTTAVAAKKERSYSEGIVLTDEHVWAEFYTEVVAYTERVSAAKKRQIEFVDMVKTVISTYGTLAPALKAWPPLWDLIPEDVKDTHRKIVERVKKEVVLNVDINKLTAMAAFARIT
jgi:hypothetical protein